MNKAMIDSYKQLLKNHDWYFEFADDGDVYRNGRKERNALVDLAREYDPMAVMWNRAAPNVFRIKPTLMGAVA